ncbi:MAG: response regulator transcription factor [Proteobacteria bacterium]|nr:DNA-binding response regulator [Pseudomonadota bacterium]NOG60431.1 response regulator transcription factor [Pseudomonadota bacterium]
MKILIVDDEALARERLHDLVIELFPNAVTVEAINGLDALDKITEHTPEIVLLDIRMPGMDGLEVANHVLLMETPPAIVFTTAYQDHALSAFDANAVDYLLKPIRKERLKTAIDRAAVMNQTKLASLNNAENISSQRTHLSAMIQGNIQLIAIENIYYLKADNKYVTAAWPGGELLLDESLVSLEAEFSDQFIRIHRNALVAINHIEALKKPSDGQHTVKLSDMPVELAVSRRHLQEVKKVFK